MRKKSSTRSGQYKQASRKRASRKLRRDMSKKVKRVSTLSLGISAIIALSWIFYSGTAQLWQQQLAHGFYQQTAKLGLALQQVYLSGHDRISRHAILYQAGLKYGQPILEKDLHELRKRLESLPQVKQVTIARQLPHTMRIHVQERHPIALWQNEETLHLVDQDGVLMGQAVNDEYHHLPLLVGPHAYKQAGELMALLRTAPQLYTTFDSAVHVSERRWNIWLKSGVEVKLPEDGAVKALAKLEELQEQKGIDGQRISSIDLRVPNRMFIRPKLQILQKASHRL